MLSQKAALTLMIFILFHLIRLTPALPPFHILNIFEIHCVLNLTLTIFLQAANSETNTASLKYLQLNCKS